LPFTVERVLLESLRFRKARFQKKNVAKLFSSKLRCTGDRLSTKFSSSYNAISKNYNKRRLCAGKDVSKMKKVSPDKKPSSVKHLNTSTNSKQVSNSRN
jgi:hypothetical protein